jgi:uncharacterized protein (DUF302 family)
MATRQLIVQRFSVTSSKPFRDAVTAFQAAIGHPDMSSFSQNIAAAKTFSEVERIVQGGVGPSGLMEFARMDLGAVLRKKNGTAALNSMRFIVGNPVIMSRMLQQVPDAGSYAPVTVLIDEREDGTYFSYDRMASFLDVYGNPAALKVARELDAKVEALLTSAAR